VAGKHVAKNIKQALIVPGSRGIKSQAEKEGLDKIFTAAGSNGATPAAACASG